MFNEAGGGPSDASIALQIGLKTMLLQNPFIFGVVPENPNSYRLITGIVYKINHQTCDANLSTPFNSVTPPMIAIGARIIDILTLV